MTAVRGELAPDLANVAALGLVGTEHPVQTEPVAPSSWPKFRSEVRSNRLTGLLLDAVHDGLFAATDGQRDELESDHLRLMSSALVLESMLLDAVALLERLGVDMRVIKGAAVAYLDYDRPELRCFSDVDVLVRSEQVDAAVHALTELGLRRRFVPPRSSWDRRFSKGVTFRSADGAELDLHRTLAAPPIGLRIVLDDLWDRSEPLVVGGRQLTALPREERLLNAAYSAAIGDPEPALATLRDIAQIALDPHLDHQRAIDLARRWSGQAVLACAVTAAWRQLRVADVIALSAWAARYRPSETEARELALYQGIRSSETARALASIRVLPSVPSRLGYLWGLARADAGFFQPSGRPSLGRVARAVRELRRARRSI